MTDKDIRWTACVCVCVCLYLDREGDNLSTNTKEARLRNGGDGGCGDIMLRMMMLVPRGDAGGGIHRSGGGGCSIIVLRAGRGQHRVGSH